MTDKDSKQTEINDMDKPVPPVTGEPHTTPYPDGVNDVSPPKDEGVPEQDEKLSPLRAFAALFGF